MTLRTRTVLCAIAFLVMVGNAAAVSFIQVNAATPQTPQSTVTVTYRSAQGPWNLNVVVVGWNDSAAVVTSVTDTKGNVYQRAVGPTVLAGAAGQSIYFATKIAAAAANENAVTVRFNQPAVYPDIRILEYGGVDMASPVDVTAAATGNSAMSASGAATTTNPHSLIFGANLVLTGTRAAGAGFTRRVITVPDGDIAEDRTVTAIGSYEATAPLTSAGPWIMQMVAFKAALPDLTVVKSHAGNFTQGQTGAAYTIAVMNVGPGPTSGTVTVADTLPAGLTASALGGTGWNCSVASLTCTRGDPLAASAGYPAITLTVNVAADAPSGATNTAAVSGGGDASPGNNSASDPTIVNQAAAAPSVTVNQAAGQADPTGAAPINFTVVFSSPVTGFTGGDVVIGGTAGGTKSVLVTGDGATYNAAVSGMTGGTVIAAVPADAARDAAGNGNTASTGTDNSVTFATTALPAPAAAYGFNEGTGATAADASGNGNTGTISGAAWTTAGRYGNALSFNGSNAYVDLGNPASLRITGSMTWSAWVMATGNPPDDGQIVAKSSNTAGWQLKSSPDTGPHTFGIAISSDGNSHVQRYGNTVRALNTWYHVAGVYNAAARTLDIYVNGVPDNGVLSGTVPASQFDAAQNVTVGRRSGGFDFQGTIDEVRVYNAALTQAQVQADMNTPVGGTPPPSDTVPPQVSVTFPPNNAQVTDIVAVTADASDNAGVAGVQFLVDGVNVGAEDTEPPYGLAWDTRTVANGAHALTARARDASGNATLSAPIAVSVANTNSFQNEILATGFALPTSIEFLPDGRMLVVELQGTIRILPAPYTQPDTTPFLQLANVGSAGVQQGIYDIALDPDFANNRFYYVFYTAGTPNRDRLSRFTANASLAGTVPGSELVLYEDPQNAHAEHHGGAVNFGNDGKIYFTTGEHFNAGDSQLLSNPRGKIHRINKDGTVPADNPFHDGAGPRWDSIWAFGLRNPYRAYYDAPTGRLFVGDVGGNDNAVAKEEVNLGVAGANYGWPNSEGACSAPCSAPIHFYPHNGRDACVTGGFVYRGTQFPGSYQGSYFFADYTQNWIRRLTFDGSGSVDGVLNFEPSDGSVDGPYGDIVYLTEGPDGAIYYVDLGYSDIGGTFGVSKIRRIRYVQSNQAPIAAAAADPASGPPPLTVAFSSAGSLDPEGRPITYLWTFGDGATSTAANPAHTYAQAGRYVARLTVSDGVNSALSAPLVISAGNKPTAAILSPQDGALFIAGDTISFSGEASDAEDGVLPASAFTWNIDFLHEGHVHPGVPVTGVKSGAFAIPTSGHDFSGFTRYRLQLTVADSSGLQDVKAVAVYPKKANLAFDTLPTGLTLKLDGIDRTTPFVHDTLVNFTHIVEAPNQKQGPDDYAFSSWSDGGAAQHVITVPAAGQSYLALYAVAPNPPPSGLVAGWSFKEGTGTSAGDSSGNGNLLTLRDGAAWSSGRYNGGISLTGNAAATAADSASLNLSGSFTLMAWIRPASLNGYQTVLIKESTPGSGGCGYWLQTVGDRISSGFNNGSGCNEHAADAGLQTGTWHHIAAVFDDTADSYRIYLNGALLSSQSEPTAPIPNNQDLTLGRTAFTENWNGLLDEVRIYGRALSQAEIQAGMDTSLP